jgi:hypothetical protein
MRLFWLSTACLLAAISLLGAGLGGLRDRFAEFLTMASQKSKTALTTLIRIVHSRRTKRPSNKPNLRRPKPYRGQGRP